MPGLHMTFDTKRRRYKLIAPVRMRPKRGNPNWFQMETFKGFTGGASELITLNFSCWPLDSLNTGECDKSQQTIRRWLAATGSAQTVNVVVFLVAPVLVVIEMGPDEADSKLNGSH